MNASRAEATLGDFKTASFAQQQVTGGYPYIGQAHFHVAMRCIVVTKHAEGANHRDTGCVGGYQNHRLLFVAASVGVGFAHNDVDRAARIAST